MIKNKNDDLINYILQTCCFSEYLPSFFNTAFLDKTLFSLKNNNIVTPIVFTMDKFNDYNNRRFIYIPDVFNFINAVNALTNNPVFKKIVKKNKLSPNSLSKFITEQNTIKSFKNGYEDIKMITSTEKISTTKDENFFNNLNTKLLKSAGCECILHLDISNCFNSIYTHNIATILKGEAWATKQYQTSSNTQEYIALKNLDNKIAAMNNKRTHGLLTGPNISFIIAEAILTTIDEELKSELDKIEVDFVRYVDDYDVFVKNSNCIKNIIDIFNKTLQRYGLQLNDSKTKVETFPFYISKDFSKLHNEKDSIINSYAVFANIEKSKKQNGSMLYFCEKILTKYLDNEVSVSLLFSILKNHSKALISCCNNINNINEKDTFMLEKLLFETLVSFIDKKFDLEACWVLETLLSINPNFTIPKEFIENLNEISLVVYLHISKNPNYELLKCIAKNKGWLLNYELFFLGLIDEGEFSENLKIDKIQNYITIKNKKINFYGLPY